MKLRRALQSFQWNCPGAALKKSFSSLHPPSHIRDGQGVTALSCCPLLGSQLSDNVKQKRRVGNRQDSKNLEELSYFQPGLVGFCCQYSSLDAREKVLFLRAFVALQENLSLALGPMLESCAQPVTPAPRYCHPLLACGSTFTHVALICMHTHKNIFLIMKGLFVFNLHQGLTGKGIAFNKVSYELSTKLDLKFSLCFQPSAPRSLHKTF